MESQSDEKVQAEIHYLAAQAEHLRAQAASLSKPARLNPALWTVIGTVIVAGVGYVATFRSQAYSDLVALKEEQLRVAEEKLPGLQADLDEKQVQLINSERRIEAAKSELDSRQRELQSAYAELENVEQKREAAERRLATLQIQLRNRERELVAAQERLGAVIDTLAGNTAQIHAIGRNVLSEQRSRVYMDTVFGTNSCRPDARQIGQVVGFVFGRAMQIRERELAPLLQRPAE